jgi:hypothetical protein
VDNKNSKHLVLKVVNGVAKWVDVRDVTERFIGSKRDGFPTRYLAEEPAYENYEELE